MALLRSVFGEFSWAPPDWLARLGARRLFLVIGAVLLVALAAFAASRYFESLPKPPRVVADTIAPGLATLSDNKLVTAPLTINFSVQTDPRSSLIATNSVANLAQVGSVISEGVSLSPQIEGTWRWQTESQLSFTPKHDWPAGQDYTARYEPSLFAPNLLLADTQTTFSTPEFSASLDAFEFYQDPATHSERRVVATLSFSHPVDQQSLERHLSLAMRESGATIDTAANPVDYKVTYDNQQRTAHVHSVAIDIPQQESYLGLQLTKGLAPAQGPSRFGEELARNVTIPDISSYFQVENVTALIARNSNDEPLQTLTFEFTDRVPANRLAEKLTAYLLPKSPTIDGTVSRNKYWRGPREVTAEVLAQAKKVPLKLNPVSSGRHQNTDQDTGRLHSASIDLPANRTLYLVIDSGLRSAGDFVLSRRYDTLARTPGYPEEAKIAQAGAILPLTRDHQLSFVARGVNSLRVDIGRLPESQVNHLASQTRGDLKSPQFNNYSFNADNLTTRSTRFIDLAEAHPRESLFASLDMTEFVPGGGYYFVTVQGWNPQREIAVGPADTRFVLITDLGLLVKTNADGSQDVFVHSIESGEPVAGAEVALLGKNGVPVLQQTTAADGHTRLSPANDLYREKTPTVYVVRNGQDSVFMPFGRRERMLQYSRFDVGGDYSHSSDKNALKAQLFTDRGLYRPGDTTRLAAIVKRSDWASVGALPLQLDVRDPRGQVVMNKRLKLPEAGFLEATFGTEAGSPTGNYNATLYLIDDKNRRRALGSEAFRVEEFLPDRLRIRSEISGHKPNGWLKPEDLVCNVSLQNLFGTPADARKVTGELELKPASLTMASYPGYVFDDPLRNPDSTVAAVRRALSPTTTDQNGQAQLPLDLNQYNKGIYQLTVYADGFEAGGGRSVSAQASVMLSPLDHLIGYKATTDLAFLDKGSEHAIAFLTVNSNAEPMALDGLTMTLTEEKFVSTLVRRSNGTFAYQSVKQEEVVRSETLSIASDGTNYRLPTNQSGTFALKISGADGLTYSKVNFTVAGARNLAGNLERNAELELNLKGKSFEPGESIELEITAPYTGTGLITIERDRVYSYQWFKSTTTTSVQSIRVPEGLEGNAYVNVAFVRDLDSPEVFVSPLSYAVAPFNISRTKRTIDIQLATDKLIRPGAELEISYSTSQPARIVMYAVDEGILQVAKYEQPRPLAFFLRKQALQVNTAQIVDLILPDFAAFRTSAAPGGGEAKSLAGKNLNPFRRQTQAPVVFWSGIVDAGTETQTLAFPVPDHFNGQLRVFAVAVADAAVGSTASSTTVRGPFVITPNVLTAAAPGDEFDITVGLSNNLQGSGANAAIELSVAPSEHLQIVGETSSLLAIAEGREGRARFRVKALDNPGPASLRFVARLGDETASLRSTLSVRPAVAYVATVAAGVGKQDPLELRFKRTLYDQLASQSAAASTSPLILTDGLLSYLDGFPHACAEQIVSKVFPQIGFLGQQDYSIDEAKIRAGFAGVVQKLRSRQNSDGGFLFWPTSRQAADFPSVYIVHFLTDAKALDLPVPRDMLAAGLGYLQQLAARETPTLELARLRAYAIYVLTRNGTITTNYLTNLHDYLDRSQAQIWHADLTATYMAASYELLKQSQLSDRLLGKYQMGAGDEMVSDFDTRLGRDAQYVYLLSRHFPNRLGSINANAIQQMVQPIMRNRFNTLSSAYTVLALGAYTRATRATSETAKLSLSATTEGASQLLADAAEFVRTKVANNVESLQISGASDQPFYYVLSQTGFDRTLHADAQAEGIELQREYLDAAGKPVTEAAIGSELRVRLRVRSTGPARSNIALVDMLPGGFEVVADSVRDQYGGWNVDYRDVREDRVVFYGSFGNTITEITYQVKVTTSGAFTAPSAFAGSMYDPGIQAHTQPGQFQVTDPQ